MTSLLVFLLTISTAFADDAKLAPQADGSSALSITSHDRHGTSSQLFSIFMGGGAERQLDHLGARYAGKTGQVAAYDFLNQDGQPHSYAYDAEFTLLPGKSAGFIYDGIAGLRGEAAAELFGFVNAALNLHPAPDAEGLVTVNAKFVVCTERPGDPATAACSVTITPDP